MHLYTSTNCVFVCIYKHGYTVSMHAYVDITYTQQRLPNNYKWLRRPQRGRYFGFCNSFCQMNRKISAQTWYENDCEHNTLSGKRRSGKALQVTARQTPNASFDVPHIIPFQMLHTYKQIYKLLGFTLIPFALSLLTCCCRATQPLWQLYVAHNTLHIPLKLGFETSPESLKLNRSTRQAECHLWVVVAANY